MSELKWRETVAGVYWKAGQYRVEEMNGRRYVALKFTPDWINTKRVGDYATLQEAKDACAADMYAETYEQEASGE